MSDRLLPLYDQELAFLRTLAGQFAEAHPKIAGRLRLSADAVDDPHVARLMEGFALVAARIRQKLDDEFPELTDSMLGVLYPHMLAPFPSAAIAGFAPSPEIDGAYAIPRHTAVEMEPIEGESCRYRTTQDVTLWPIAVRRIELSGRPLVAPDGPAHPVRRARCAWSWNAWTPRRASRALASTGCASTSAAPSSMAPRCTSCCATTW